MEMIEQIQYPKIQGKNGQDLFRKKNQSYTFTSGVYIITFNFHTPNLANNFPHFKKKIVYAQEEILK